MGNFINNVLDSLNSLTSNKTPLKMLMLGLDAAGKTTILYKLKLGENVSSVPTIGFNVETVQYKNLNFMIWDIGGQQKIRKLWNHYFANNQAIIYVLDSSDEERIDEAAETLKSVLSSEELKGAPLLLYANKQDMSRLTVSQIAEKMGINQIKDREWYVQGTCALTGDGLCEGLNWMAKQLKNLKKN